jgi:hypothetical protein
VSVFQVRLFPQREYQKVVAATAKEAAEARYGKELSSAGSKHQLRALVHEMIWRVEPLPCFSMIAVECSIAP